MNKYSNILNGIVTNLFDNDIIRLIKTRDDLSLRNIRWDLWSILLIFPLSVIVGDLRYFDLKIVTAGFESYELMLFPLGLGWLVLVFIPRRLIIPVLKTAAICSAALLPFQFILSDNTGILAVFMAFQFFNGVCAACAFSLFCFKLNNIERLFGMMTIMFYYGFFYTIWRASPVVQSVGKTWGGIIAVAVYLFVVFMCARKKHAELEDTKQDGRGSGALLVIGLDVVYYMIMCMINYIEWADKIIYSLPYGLGQFASIALIALLMILINRNALYIWLMFIVFSLFGLSLLIYDSPAAHFSGSLIYGLGDGLGYIIIYYLCAGAIKRSKSLKMFRIYCFVFFIQYFIISGIYSRAFAYFEGSRHLLALGIVLVLSSVCVLFIPLLQKKLFEADWTDGINLRELEKYNLSLKGTEEINNQDNLNLTSREHEIFTMLLTGMNPKEIAFTLKISYYTVDFHRKNLYRKLGIQSRAELFAKYSQKIKNY
jgi:DNA-binding CsgD family transcriptional regulator